MNADVEDQVRAAVRARAEMLREVARCGCRRSPAASAGRGPAPSRAVHAGSGPG
jgi:hypothetical protein